MCPRPLRRLQNRSKPLAHTPRRKWLSHRPVLKPPQQRFQAVEKSKGAGWTTTSYGAARSHIGARKRQVSTVVQLSRGRVASENASGGDFSGFSAQDRMVMGLCRTIADVVIIGIRYAFSADRRHVWTAAAVFPKRAAEY
jgi:hypothetical protein